MPTCGGQQDRAVWKRGVRVWHIQIHDGLVGILSRCFRRKTARERINAIWRKCWSEDRSSTEETVVDHSQSDRVLAAAATTFVLTALSYHDHNSWASTNSCGTGKKAASKILWEWIEEYTRPQ